MKKKQPCTTLLASASLYSLLVSISLLELTRRSLLLLLCTCNKQQYFRVYTTKPFVSSHLYIIQQTPDFHHQHLGTLVDYTFCLRLGGTFLEGAEPLSSLVFKTEQTIFRNFQPQFFYFQFFARITLQPPRI